MLTPPLKEFCVFFQNVATHKSRFQMIKNPNFLSMELAEIRYEKVQVGNDQEKAQLNQH